MEIAFHYLNLRLGVPVMLDTEMPCLVCKWTCRDKKEDVVLEKCRTKGDKGVSQWIKVALLSGLLCSS